MMAIANAGAAVSPGAAEGGLHRFEHGGLQYRLPAPLYRRQLSVQLGVLRLEARVVVVVVMMPVSLHQKGLGFRDRARLLMLLTGRRSTFLLCHVP